MEIQGSHRAPPKVAMAGLMVLTLVLAGCAQPADDAAMAVVIGSECLGLAAGRCAMEDGTLHLRGLRVDSQLTVGLRVDGLTVPLVIEDLEIRGASTGVYLSNTCAACPVEIRHAQIEAQGAIVSIGHFGGTSPVEGGLTIRDSQLDAVPFSSPVQPDSDIIVSPQGIIVDALAGGLTLERVRLESTTGFGRGVWDRFAESRLTAVDLNVSGFGRAIIGTWTVIDLRSVRIDCRVDAIYAPYKTNDLRADGLEITNCGAETGCDQDSFPFHAITVGRNDTAWAQTVDLRNLTMRNNCHAVSAFEFDSFKVADFTIEGELEGLSVVAREVDLRRGRIADHQLTGADFTLGKLNVERVTFEHNGFGPEGDNTRAGMRAYAFKGDLGPRTIRNSSFVGNTPWGLIASNNNPAIDAAFNWWGSPLGAAPWTLEPFGDPAVPCYGDAVLGIVITEPHLTAPPENGPSVAQQDCGRSEFVPARFAQGAAPV